MRRCGRMWCMTEPVIRLDVRVSGRQRPEMRCRSPTGSLRPCHAGVFAKNKEMYLGYAIGLPPAPAVYTGAKASFIAIWAAEIYSAGVVADCFEFTLRDDPMILIALSPLGAGMRESSIRALVTLERSFVGRTGQPAPEDR